MCSHGSNFHAVSKFSNTVLIVNIVVFCTEHISILSLKFLVSRITSQIDTYYLIFNDLVIVILVFP